MTTEAKDPKTPSDRDVRDQRFVRPALQHWGVDVRVNGEDVLTIESNSLCGKTDLSAMELDAIRTAANHLLAFAGQPTRHRMNQIMRETNGRFESR